MGVLPPAPFLPLSLGSPRGTAGTASSRGVALDGGKQAGEPRCCPQAPLQRRRKAACPEWPSFSLHSTTAPNSLFNGERIVPVSPGDVALGQHRSHPAFCFTPQLPLLQQRVGAQRSFLFLTALGKKRILKGFEHSSLNSSLKLRGFTADYGKRPPAVGGRRRQVLGSCGAEERQESCGQEQEQGSRICPRTCWGQTEQGGGHQWLLVDGTEQPLLRTGLLLWALPSTPAWMYSPCTAEVFHGFRVSPKH